MIKPIFCDKCNSKYVPDETGVCPNCEAKKKKKAAAKKAAGKKK